MSNDQNGQNQGKQKGGGGNQQKPGWNAAININSSDIVKKNNLTEDFIDLSTNYIGGLFLLGAIPLIGKGLRTVWYKFRPAAPQKEQQSEPQKIDAGILFKNRELFQPGGEFENNFRSFVDQTWKVKLPSGQQEENK